jgi:hypothetical protein
VLAPGPVARYNDGVSSVALCAAGLAKRYGSVRALDGLDLEVGVGEVHAFLGPTLFEALTLALGRRGRMPAGTCTGCGAQHSNLCQWGWEWFCPRCPNAPTEHPAEPCGCVVQYLWVPKTYATRRYS